jgi:uncharacterized membrane protein YbhN (UPF0104 family)
MAQHPVSSHRHIRLERKRLIILGLFLLLLYIVLPQLKAFHSSLSVIRHAQLDWVLVGFCFAFGTYLAAAGVYYVLAQQPLRYGRSVLVQLASTFANRLLPAGIGAIGVNYRYLRRMKHSSAQAAAVVAINNTVGLVGHLLLLVVAALTSTAISTNLKHHHYHIGFGVVIMVGIIVVIIFILLIRWHRFRQVIKNILISIKTYKLHRLKLLTAIALSIVLTSLYGLCLLACTHAIGLHLAVAQLFIILTLGVAGGTVAPTPGGLLGAEAGLVAGLVAYGVSGADALAVALLYRLLTYWLPLVFGGVAFIVAERKQLI